MMRLPACLLISLLPLAACAKDENKSASKETNSQPSTPPEKDKDQAKPDEKQTETPTEVEKAPAKDYLSKAWASHSKKNTQGAAESAKALEDEGYALYKKKKDADAIVKYEAALDAHPNGQLYYRYANSLSNIPRLEDSIKAYEIALELGYEKPEMALYNAACAYSRLKQAEPAYVYLAKAIAKGYNAFHHIEKDSDMEFLRSQPDWKEKIEALVPEDIRLGKDKFVGELSVMTPRDPEEYTLCSNGTIYFHSIIGSDNSCCGSDYKGKWSLKSGALEVTWTEVCGSKGEGNSVGANAACDEFPKCSKPVCGPPKGDYAQFTLVEADEVAAMKKKPNKELIEDGEASVTPFKGKEPKVCQ